MPTDGSMVFESDERLVVGDTPYVLMYGDPSPGELRLFKPRLMVEGYEPIIEEFRGANIMELGIYSGGSTAYFAQRCDPRRLVALDREPHRVADLDRFLDEHGLSDRVSLHHGVDQSDRDALRTLAEQEFGGEGIDLVIDDASHLYHPTVASFEVLFPFVRPGGLYVIEDWTADDWLVTSFQGALAHRDPIARRMVETWIAESVTAGDLVASVFARWLRVTLPDAGAPDHELAAEWCRTLDRPGAGEDARVIAHWLRGLAMEDEGDTAPTLGTLGMQLLLAVKSLCPSIASVAVSPWAIAVRRGGPIDADRFTVDSIAKDHFGLLAALRPGQPDAVGATSG